MRRLQLIGLALLAGSITALAQGNIDVGVRGGATFTHGHTTVPAISITAGTIPQLNNKNNGIGMGYSTGIWGRKNFTNFFIQVEADYDRFVLKQKTDFSVSAAVAASLAGQSLPAQIPSSTPTAINIISESMVESVTVPVLFGKTWADGKIRAYIGPDIQFLTKAQIKRTLSASILSFSFSVPETTTDLKNPDSQSFTDNIIQVKSITYGGIIGVGYTFFRRFDLDARYAAPVGGIYKNKDITGYLGIASLSLGVRLF